MAWSRGAGSAASYQKRPGLAMARLRHQFFPRDPEQLRGCGVDSASAPPLPLAPERSSLNQPLRPSPGPQRYFFVRTANRPERLDAELSAPTAGLRYRSNGAIQVGKAELGVQDLVGPRPGVHGELRFSDQSLAQADRGFAPQA